MTDRDETHSAPFWPLAFALLVPLLVRDQAKGKYQLVAGYRRVTACDGMACDSFPPVDRGWPEYVLLEE